MKKWNKALASVLALSMVCGMMTGCGKQTTGTPVAQPEATETVAETPAATDTTVTETPAEPAAEPTEAEKYWFDEFDVMTLGSKEYGTDYESLYDHVGKDITIADVTEDPDTGFGYITVDGEQHLLGLDFLSFAMVYNNTPAGEYATEDDVYAAWWRLYITRWNALLPEIPLYSNEYYDLYNAKIGQVQENPTNPYWSPADALIDWTSAKDDNDIIIGNSTELSGQFRYPTFGKSSPGAADNDVNTLITGLETVSKNKEGGYEWNDTVVASHEDVVNDDGSKTFTITIKDDLVYSDGTPITAKDYLVFPMAFYTQVATQASGSQVQGLTVVGYEDYNAYTGPDSTEGTKEMAGFRLLDDYTFSVTISPDYIPYFYDITYASFSPSYPAMWLGDADIMDDGNGCYLTDNFYEKSGDDYKVAAIIKATATDTSEEAYAKYPYSGPYCVKSFDTTDSSAVLVKNPNFKGNYEGTVPAIEKIIYKKVVSATQLEDFKAGGLDIISGITGGAATDEALALADGSDGAYAYIHYSRAGYGKLGFRADYGPAQFAEVRQAIAYCMNRGQFAKDFTGGYGGVVDGPYYTGSWMYQAASKQGMTLNAYATSADSAIAVLEEGGWVYAADGSDYVEGIRYKKIPGDVITENDKNYQSVDGTYKTTEVNGDYYMPLVINWYGTVDNEFTDLLQTGFKENDNVRTAGMAVYNTTGDFAPMLDELYQAAVYGYYSGSPMYCAFNFATGFNSAVYDYSYNLTINPSMYDDYSAYYIKDSADIFWLK
ncbi:MAG: hypothetical protein IKS07_08625 [Lachnospiraceae bacterium]|nr:hypothetical protein [Lachnospiraceae bacterium]